jgi:hypothetical protein
MAEWFKAAVLKTVEGREVLREFESLSLRQEISRREISLLACGSWQMAEGEGELMIFSQSALAVC